MTVYVPLECSKEFEKIFCKSIQIKQIFSEKSYNNVSYIKLRKYNSFRPRIMVLIKFDDGYFIYKYNITELITYNHNLILPEKIKWCCFY